MHSTMQSGTAVVANDDVYKRSLTWNLYAGDGYQASVVWLRKRIARFLYGTNGTDISVDDLLNVSIKLQITEKAIGYAGKAPYMRQFPYMATQIYTSGAEYIITIPNIPIAQTFKTLFDAGILQSPFQVNYTVTLA